ncbi:hypothetical protein EJ04DRAFT_501168 [Polyplosphaeria fusca]|uniref:Carbohydrate kinase PfkB domain-containing protein n=1 Tax=Polyplosphaeria fusca TaxID=682080 RepID=A0A9P4UZD5_9PLEO|nr:hypothetical protein EJ04DRAFT_501168 [Polyplosphaeria fusca]
MNISAALLRPRLPLRTRLLSTSASRRYLTNNGFFRVSDEVREAIHSRKPVVALETTIYTHGFPYPENVALASLLESVVRVNGGVPATIGILDGVARVGLDPEELIRLTESAGKSTTLKLSRRDLGYVCGLRLAGKKFNGGTTIAGTMILAHLAGIKVFGTGGLGGVHRGGEHTLDVSADLTELGRTPVAVISSGCKSFLDIPRTLEYLETEGVGVGTFADGRTGNVDFPAFWSRESGVKSPTTISDEMEAAAIIYAQEALQIQSGLHFANPCPSDKAIPKAAMDMVINEAVRQADAQGITGKDNTPFILHKIKELTKGSSVPANRALIESNVRRATIVARELSVLQAQQENAQSQGIASAFIPPTSSISPSPEEEIFQSMSTPYSQSTTTVLQQRRSDLVVAGALAVDFSCDYSPFLDATNSTTPSLQTSNPARIHQSLGGVGHNIAKAAHLLGSSVRLCSAAGDDFTGRAALSQLENDGMQTDGIVILPTPHRTAQYVAVNDVNKDLMLAMADMSILESLDPSTIQSTYFPTPTEAPPKCVIVDGNWPSEALHVWFRHAKSLSAQTIFEPVSTAKATRIFSSSEPPSTFPQHIIDIATPNTYELKAMHARCADLELFSDPAWFKIVDALGISPSGLRVPLAATIGSDLVDAGIPQQSIQLLPFIPAILTKLGPKGVLLVKLLQADDPALSLAKEAQYVLARNSNGDGESNVGGLYVRLFPPEIVLGPGEVVSVNGIGDTFVAAMAVSLVRGRRMDEAIPFAQKAALHSLQSQESVSFKLVELRDSI